MLVRREANIWHAGDQRQGLGLASVKNRDAYM